MKYMIIEKTNVAILVNDKIAEGWRPLGGVATGVWVYPESDMQW